MLISRDYLLVLLAMQRQATIVTLAAVTDPAMRKRGNPHAGAKKIAKVGGVINWRYTKAVNAQRQREGQPLLADGSLEHFYAQPRAWGGRIYQTPLVHHEGRIYLELKRDRQLQVEYRDAAGRPIDEAELAPFLRERDEDEGRRQRLQKPVVLRDYAVDSIVQICMNGQVYDVERGAEGQSGQGAKGKKPKPKKPAQGKLFDKGRPAKKAKRKGVKSSDGRSRSTRPSGRGAKGKKPRRRKAG